MTFVHNTYTKLAAGLLMLNSLVGTALLAILVMGGQLVALIFIGALFLFNTWLAWRTWQGDHRALQWAMWFYLLQILAIETADWNLYLTFGVHFSISWPLESGKIDINLFALLFSLLLFKAWRSAGSTPSIQSDNA